MDNNEIAYQNALSQVEESITRTLSGIEDLPVAVSVIDEKSESALDGWDYCYAIAIGLAGIYISTNASFAQYLDEIHKAASGASGDYDFFQTVLGNLLHHKGDAIDSINGTFKNRNGTNAYGLFHRLLWGHDPLSIGVDNPFRLMFQQRGMFGIVQTVRHLLADTASKQGLPLPGSSFFDIVDENDKTSNYLIKIAQNLSQETFGNKAKAQEIYAHIATVRAQDIAGGIVVKSLSELYFKARKICDDIRCAEIRLIAYAVNFFGEAVVGCVRQNGVPYINIPLATAMAFSFGYFCHLNSKKVHLLSERTDELHTETEELMYKHDKFIVKLPSYKDGVAYIEALDETDKNYYELISFFGEDLP